MFEESVKGVLMMFQGSFKAVSGILRGGPTDLQEVFTLQLPE